MPTVAIHPFGRSGWVHPDQPQQDDYEQAERALAYAQGVMVSGQADIIILDEVNVALDYGLLDLEAILALLREKPPAVELILTGRNAHPDIIHLADLVTEMHKVKHPYDEGISGRQGIEF